MGKKQRESPRCFLEPQGKWSRVGAGGDRAQAELWMAGTGGRMAAAGLTPRCRSGTMGPRVRWEAGVRGPWAHL